MRKSYVWTFWTRALQICTRATINSILSRCHGRAMRFPFAKKRPTEAKTSNTSLYQRKQTTWSIFHARPGLILLPWRTSINWIETIWSPESSGKILRGKGTVVGAHVPWSEPPNDRRLSYRPAKSSDRPGNFRVMLTSLQRSHGRR